MPSFERIGRVLLYLGLILSLLLTGTVLVVILVQGGLAFELSLLLRAPSVLQGQAGLLPQLVNTIVLCGLSLLLALPMGFGCAVLLLRAKQTLSLRLLDRALCALSAVPTAVYGLFGLLAFSQTLSLRYSILSGGLTMALLLLPIAAKTATRAMQGAVRRELVYARALGATEAEGYLGVVLPATRRGLSAAALLCACKVAGESAALLLTAGIGNAMPSWNPASWGRYLLSSGATLAVGVYQSLLEGENEAAFCAALLVLVLLLLLGQAARWLGGGEADR